MNIKNFFRESNNNKSNPGTLKAVEKQIAQVKSLEIDAQNAQHFIARVVKISIILYLNAPKIRWVGKAETQML